MEEQQGDQSKKDAAMTHGQNHNLRALTFIRRHQLKKAVIKLKNRNGACPERAIAGNKYQRSKTTYLVLPIDDAGSLLNV